MSSSEDEMSVRGVQSAHRQRLFSDDEDDDRASNGERPRARSDDDDEEQRRRDKDTDEEAEEERRRQEKKKKEEEKKKKPKGPVRRQMISEDMLTGKNGISKIPELFENFKFGGKGKEKQDLDFVLAKLEHWVHLLHPKYPFDQCLQRIEFLGMKRKVVKVHLKKIRMGLVENVVDDAPIIDDDNEIDEALEAASMVAASAVRQNETPVAAEVDINDDDINQALMEMAQGDEFNPTTDADDFDDEDIQEAIREAEAGPIVSQRPSTITQGSDGFDDDEDFDDAALLEAASIIEASATKESAMEVDANSTTILVETLPEPNASIALTASLDKDGRECAMEEDERFEDQTTLVVDCVDKNETTMDKTSQMRSMTDFTANKSLVNSDNFDEHGIDLDDLADD